LFMGRTIKVAAVLAADLVVYMAVISLFLRFGPAGLGPRLFQLGLALTLPAVITYLILRRKPKYAALKKPLAALAAASLLAPSLLEPIPILSLAASVALAAAPYYLPGHLPSLLKPALKLGRTRERGETYSRLDLLLLKRHVYYFRWRGPSFAPKGGVKMFRLEGLEYLRIGRTALSDAACRMKALAGAREVARTMQGVIIPATAEEVASLEWGTRLEERTFLLAQAEHEALGPLSIAGRRRLTCALEGATERTGSAADVVLRNEGEVFSVKMLSGRAVKMTPQRLRDLLDSYEMVVARE